MKDINDIFNKVFVHQFYRTNAGLFFLVLAFVGGFMRSHDHIALGEFFIGAPYLISIPTFIWILYAAFLIDFNRSQLSKTENIFLINFNLFAPVQKWRLVLSASIQQFLPALAYATFLVMLSLKHNLFLPAIIVIISCLTILFILITSLKDSLARYHLEKKESSIGSMIRGRFSKPYIIFMIEGVLRRQALGISGYKVASMLILWAALAIYHTDTYDLRLLGLAITISFFLNASFIVEWHSFENSQFTLFRRMPFSHLQRFLSALSVLLIVSIPEGLVLLRNPPEGFSFFGILIMFFYGISINLLIYCFLYSKDRKAETVMSYVSMAGIFFFMSILANVPAIVLLGLNIAAAWGLFYFYYGRFEYTSPSSDPNTN